MNIATRLSTSRQVKERKLSQSAKVSTVCWESGSIGKERGPSGRSYGDTAAGVRFENEAAGFGHEMKGLNQIQSKKWIRSREQQWVRSRSRSREAGRWRTDRQGGCINSEEQGRIGESSVVLAHMPTSDDRLVCSHAIA